MYRPATATSILLGVLSIIIGIVALAWPGVTILAIVLLFAVFAFSRSFGLWCGLWELSVGVVAGGR
jgi:uncharacterized membrane protein HdeD (DUF308 family)